MIKKTNDEQYFFEKESSDLLIWGGGNAGYWIGYYLNLCNIDFSGYIEQSIKINDDVSMCEHPIKSVESLSDYEHKKIRLILSHKNTGETIQHLMDYSEKYNIDMLCFTPWYKDGINPQEIRFNINRFLGYFRKKLIISEIPTIISNDCTAGRIYEALGLLPITPTINVMIAPKDYIRLCEKPEYYFSKEMTPCGRIRPCLDDEYSLDKDMDAGDVEGIKVLFAHNFESRDVVLQWNRARKRVNYNRIICVYSDMSSWGVMPLQYQNRFSDVKHKKLYISSKSSSFLNKKDTVYMNDNYLIHTWVAVENFFDILGWINN